MKKRLVVLTFLNCWLLATPPLAPADQVSKNSVILKEVQVFKDAQGVPIGEVRLYGGGISGRGDGIVLREMKSVKEPFSFSKGKTTISAEVIPLVAVKSHHGGWIPAAGRWDFKNSQTISYESAIHVKKGGDLDIAYQSTEMSVGDQKHVLHYGLSGNPHAISLSRTRLKTDFTSENAPPTIKPVLHYQPAEDIILVQMEFTPEGLHFKPIFDYQVIKQ